MNLWSVKLLKTDQVNKNQWEHVPLIEHGYKIRLTIINVFMCMTLVTVNILSHIPDNNNAMSQCMMQKCGIYTRVHKDET